MILKSLKLNNIRSYTSQVIHFPEGSVLLSGDIGSGKSTILLAIEFALFGILRGDMSGSALLRHGKNSGEVELHFEVDGKDVIIKRGLKRQKDAVTQDFGYIIVDNFKRDATAVELKSHILALLGYPDELLTKSKSLIYRYTVYTPQEEMKAILFEDKEARLDTLRKVFGIDKYKRIVQNAELSVKALKDQRKLLAASIGDLDLKQKEIELKEAGLVDINIKINNLKPRIDDLKDKIENKKIEIRQKESDIKSLNELKLRLSNIDVDIKNKKNLYDRNSTEIGNIKNSIRSVEEELKSPTIVSKEAINDKINIINNNIKNNDNKNKELISKISEINVKIRNSNEIKEKISRLDSCPLCLQKVGHEHKTSIISNEDLNINELASLLSALKAQQKELEQSSGPLWDELDSLKSQLRDAEIIVLKQTNLREKQVMLDRLSQSQNQLYNDINMLTGTKESVFAQISVFSSVEETYDRIRKEFDQLMAEERKLSIEYAQYVRDFDNIDDYIKNIKNEINKKIEIKEKINKLGQLQNWMEEFFINVVSMMERHVLATVYHEFNSAFQNWFGMMIEDEVLDVRLDSDFTPVIMQNGFETEMTNLSGGEKTAIALSYRLALNKVINDLIREVKTKDIIILDEPTDGFSSEQLDKLKDVLEELNARQTIIVSHEHKIESFVDNVLRITKNEHNSQII